MKSTIMSMAPSRRITAARLIIGETPVSARDAFHDQRVRPEKIGRKWWNRQTHYLNSPMSLSSLSGLMAHAMRLLFTRSSWFRDSVPRLCPGDGPRTGQKPTPFRGNELRLAGADPRADTDNTDGSRYSVEMSDCAQRWRRWCSRSQSVAVNHTLSSRKGDTALPYRPHSFTRSWRPEPYPARFKPPAARRPWQARSTHPRTTGHRRGSRISPL